MKYWNEVKMVEYYNKFSTFQVKTIAPTLVTEVKDDTTYVRLERAGTFYIEVVPHFPAEDPDQSPKRDWDHLTDFALSPLESFALDLMIRKEGKASFIHKTDTVVKSLTIQRRGDGNFDVFLNGPVKGETKGEKQSNSARLSPAQLGFLVDTMSRLRPYLMGQIGSLEACSVVKSVGE